MKVVRVLSVSPTFHKLASGYRNSWSLTSPPPRLVQPHPPSCPSSHPPGPPKPPEAPAPPRPSALPTLPARVPSLDGLQLAERRQTFREDTQDPLLDLPTCGRRRRKAPQARSPGMGRGGAPGGGSPRM